MNRCDPRDFLEVANNILRRKATRNNQIYIRTAIGRAYYAAFLTSREKLKSIGVSIREGEKVHLEVIKELKKKSGSADLLDQLRGDRVKADYYLDENFNAGKGDTCAKISEQIIRMVSTLKKET